MSKKLNILPSNLAAAVSAATLSLCVGAADLAAQEVSLEEILVTATRRAESVQDIPYNITAFSGDQLEEAGIFSLGDLSRALPGVAYADLGPRAAGVNNLLILRGLNTDQQGGIGAYVTTINPASVATYMDNTPLFTNLRLYDLNRVEVLRGPQGTLYGSGSLGGTMRFIFNKPDATEFSGSLDAGINTVEDSDETGYAVDGMLNIPLTDSAALRISGGFEEVAGYIDARNLIVGGNTNPQIADPSDPFGSPPATFSDEDTDSAERWNVRAAFLWDVTESFQAEFVYVHQDDSSDGLSYETAPGVDGRESRAHDDYFLSPLEREVDLYSLELDFDLGFATLESTSAFSQNDSRNEGALEGLAMLQDVALGGLAFGGWPETNGRLAGYNETDFEEERFVQEFRLISNGEGKLNWVAGAYYEDYSRTTNDVISTPGFADYALTDGHPFLSDPEFLAFLVPGLPPGFTFNDFGVFNWAQFLGGPPGFVTSQAIQDEAFLTLDDTLDVEDLAIYGELTYNFTEKWQVTVGARYFEVDFSADLNATLPLTGAIASDDGMDPSGRTSSQSQSDDSDTIFRLNSSYDISEDAMVYFNYAEGYRRGGANAFPLNGFFAEDPSLLTFDADTAENFEVGIKGSTDKLNYIATIFFVDWDSPQVAGGFVPSGFPAVVNAEAAETQGLELEFTWQINDAFRLAAGYTYTDAELSEDFITPPGPDGIPDFFGFAGTPLPGVPENMASVALDYSTRVGFLGFQDFDAHLDYFYRDETTTFINDVLPDYRLLDDYSIWNASVTLRNESWRLGLSIRNIADEDGFSANFSAFRDIAAYQDYVFSVRPRTVLLSLGYDF